MIEVIRRLSAHRGPAILRAKQWRQDHFGSIELIHINKTGGSSVERALGLPFSHQTAAMRLEKLGREEWDRRYSFAFVRNPWARFLSLYQYRKTVGRLYGDVEFREWIRATMIQKDESLIHWDRMFLSQTEFISDQMGQLAVDDVYRFENFSSEFGRLCDRLGVNLELPHMKDSGHRHYSAYYDEATAEIVAGAYRDDIEMFRYSFDDPCPVCTEVDDHP